MKKVLFVINSLNIGGSEKSLISLLQCIDYSKYEVNLMMFKRGGEFDIWIPKEVKILDVPKYYEFLTNKNMRMSLYQKLKFIITRAKTSINLRLNLLREIYLETEQILYKSQGNILYKLNEKYDVAIAYSQGMPTYFVSDKVIASKKIAWINCDYETTKYDKDIDELFYKNFHRIVAVSETIKESIVRIKPQYKEKIEVILDIINPNLIKKMSNEEMVFKDKSYINILTVARLVIEDKGYDTAIKAAKLLKYNGYKFKWYVVGDGKDKTKLEQLIIDYNLSDQFILLGKKENPYPFMKNCDIYVQPSKREGFGLTVVEAKILEKPIICTNFNTAKELINNGYDGIIVNNSDEDLYKGIKKYIDNKDLRKKIEKNLKILETYNSMEEINKIYNLI